MALMTGALGGSMSPRWQDRTVRKPAQQFAVQMVDRAGIVVPKSKMDALGDISTVKTAVKNQLWLKAANSMGLAVSSPDFALRKDAIQQGDNVSTRVFD